MSFRDSFKFLNVFMENEKISEASKNVVIEYFEDMKLKNLKPNTIELNVNVMMFILKNIKNDLDKLTEEDSRSFQIALLSSGYAESSQKQYLMNFKRFLRWYSKNGHTRGRKKYLEISENIERKFKSTTKTPSDLLTADEVERMVATASNHRDAAIIAILYDSGCRIGELLSCRIKDVVFTDDGCEITFPVSKTKSRTVLLTYAAGYVKEYLSRHPLRHDPDGKLIVTEKLMNIGTKENHVPGYRSLDSDTIRENLKEIAKRAGIKKRVYPHLLRHTRATEYAKTMTEANMRIIFGWTPNSNITSIYTHLSGQDAKDAIKAHHGLKVITKNSLGVEVGMCMKCDATNPVSAQICWQCKAPLTREARERREKMEKTMMDLMDNPEFMKMVSDINKSEKTEK